MPSTVKVGSPDDHEQHALGLGFALGPLVPPPPAATSTTYQENVSAKPDSGRAITHNRVSSQNGSRLVTMSRIVPRGSTAYASVKTARSVVRSVCAGRPPVGTQ